MHRHKIRFSLLLITILGFALRFYQPEDLGYFHVHNLENLNNARAWLDLTAFLENNLGAITSLKERNISISEVKNQWAVQSNHVNHLFGDVHYNIFLATNWPGFILLNILATLLWGVQLQSLGYFAAIFGVLCIPSFYFLGKAYKDSATGLICALLVATSAFSIILSRFAYDGQQYIPFFSSLMLAFVLRGLDASSQRGKMYFYAGICGGWNLCTQPVAIPVVGSLVLYEAIRYWLKKDSLKPLGAMIGGISVVLILFQIPYLLTQWILGPQVTVLYPGFTNYFEVYLFLMGSIKHQHSLLLSFSTFITTYPMYETVLSCALLIIGFVTIRHSWNDGKTPLLVFTLLLPTIYWVLVSENPPEPRHYFCSMLPLLILVSARGFEKAGLFLSECCKKNNFLKRPLLWRGALSVLAICFAYLNMEPIYAANSGFKKAADWLSERGENRVSFLQSQGVSLHWLQYDIQNQYPQGDESRGYLAIMPVYTSDTSTSHFFLKEAQQAGKTPVFEVDHRFPQREYEYRFAQTAFSKGVDYLPLIGESLRRIRSKAIKRNEQRKILLFDLEDEGTREILRRALDKSEHTSDAGKNVGIKL